MAMNDMSDSCWAMYTSIKHKERYYRYYSTAELDALYKCKQLIHLIAFHMNSFDHRRSLRGLRAMSTTAVPSQYVEAH